MNLTPLEIRKHEFSSKLKGFDKDEVTSFLEMVADQFEQLLVTSRKQAESLETLEAKLQDYKQMESTLQDTMINAKKAGKDVEQESTMQAEFIVQQAKLEAEQMLFDAKKKHQQLQDNVDRLEGQRRSFILKMKQILRGQIELLEVLDEESLSRINHDPGQLNGAEES